MDDVSILIRTKNEARWLPVTVQAIHRQQVQPREIVIVDSGSTDGTLATVAGFPGVRVVTISPETFTFGRALNIGFQEAKGRYVACLSAHAVPTEVVWLSSLLCAFRDPRTAGAYGRQLPQSDACLPIRRDLLTCYGTVERIQVSSNDHFFSNANALIRRDVWRHFPFDEGLTYCEDQLWARKVIAANYQMAYVPRAAVYHSHNESLAGVYRRAYLEALAWRTIDPGRTRALRDAWREWRWNTAADAAYIFQSRARLRWLPFSAAYRFAQTLGRSRAFRGGSAAPRARTIAKAAQEEEKSGDD